MTQKQFILTVPMLPEDKLVEVEYQSADNPDLPVVRSRFPGIALLIWNLAKADTDVHITLVMTEDDNQRGQANLELLRNELTSLSKDRNIKFCMGNNVTLPHNETAAKQLETFRKLTSVYHEGGEVFCDITYGTKVTPICIFASLAYAEKVKGCAIKSIIYGKYTHDGSDQGTIYDIRSVYELNMTVNAMDGMHQEEVDNIIELIWGRP